MNEFDIIRHYFQRDVSTHKGVRTGIGDDAAVVSVPNGQELVLTMDTLIEGVHFPATTAAADIGWKALAVNLSDLAAMGAEPRWVTLSLTLPEADSDWLEKFSNGFFELAGQYSIALIGGDLTRGQLSITVQAHGVLPAGQALTRGGARTGDRIFVSGCLGDAGFALTMNNSQQTDYFCQRLNRPMPRLALGQALRGLASSAIDISDGLAGDLRHILDAGDCGARVDTGKLPVSAALAAAVDGESARRLAATAGDDYELCFTVAPHDVVLVDQLSQELAIPLTAIGTIVAGNALDWNSSDQASPYSAFQHF